MTDAQNLLALSDATSCASLRSTPLHGRYKGKAWRWVIERTNSWHNRFRGLLIRWERIGALYLSLVHFAYGLIAFQQAR